MSIATAPARIVPLLDVAPSSPSSALADEFESLEADTDTAFPEALSRGVIALIATAALALSAVCTALLLTFASTSIAPPTLTDDTPAPSVSDSIHG